MISEMANELILIRKSSDFNIAHKTRIYGTYAN